MRSYDLTQMSNVIFSLICVNEKLLKNGAMDGKVGAHREVYMVGLCL